MPKLKAFSILDGKTSSWSAPAFLQHTGQAERMFVDLANDGQSMISKYPTDFSLYEVGSWDDDKCILSSMSPFHLITTGASVKRKPSDEPGLPLPSTAPSSVRPVSNVR